MGSTSGVPYDPALDDQLNPYRTMPGAGSGNFGGVGAPPLTIVRLAGYTFGSDPEEVYLASDGNHYVGNGYQLIGAPLTDNTWSPSGEPPRTGGATRPERPPMSDTVWKDNGDGTETLWETQYDLDGRVISAQPVAGTTRPLAQDKTPQIDYVTRNGKTYKITTHPDGSTSTEEVLGLPAEEAPEPGTTGIQTKLPNGNIGVLMDDGNFKDTGVPWPVEDEDAPELKTFPDNSLWQWDKVAGDWVKIADAPPKDNTAKEVAAMQIAANAANNAARMAFDAAENAAQRAFQAAENEKNRAFEAKENKLGREQDWAIEQGRREQEHKDRQLAAAEAFATYVNSVDPTALPAFLAAGGGKLGGGSLVNAANEGASAITDKALLPAARQLGIAREDFVAAVSPEAQAAASAAASRGSDPLSRSGLGYRSPRQGLGGGMGQTGSIVRTPNNAGGDPLQRKPRDFSEWKFPMFAEGGMTRAPMFMVGDSIGPNPWGQANPEMIQNPTGAPIRVTPIPRFAYGTELASLGPVGRAPGVRITAPTNTWDRPKQRSWDRPHSGRSIDYGDDDRSSQIPPPPPAPSPPAPDPAPPSSTVPVTTPGTVGSGLDLGITAADRTLMDEVLALRTGINQLESPGYIYNLDFWNQLPTWQKAYALGLQAKYGIGAEDWQAEAARNRLAGMGRQGMTVRY